MNEKVNKMFKELNLSSNDSLSDNLVSINKDWESYTSVVNMMKNKDNSNEKVLVWYLKSKSNMDDLSKTFDISKELIDKVKYSHDSLAYMNVYKVYNSIASFMGSIIVSDKIVKKMDSFEYNAFMNILRRCRESLEMILDLPIVNRNVNRKQVMKERKKSLCEMCNQYSRIKQPKEVKTNRKDLVKKGLSFAAGLVGGAAMSCVPGCGYIRMGLAAGKIGTSTINRWIDRHPNGNVARIFNKIGSKLNPKIPGFVNKIKDTMRGNYINVFINGMAVGYIAGNIFELVTGNTIIGAISEQLNSVSSVPVDVETSTVDNSINIKVDDVDNTLHTTTTTIPTYEAPSTVADTQPIAFDNVVDTPVVDVPPVIDDSIVIDEVVNTPVTTIDFGQSIDVSSIDYGYGTSIDPLVGNEPVRLFNDLGHNVHIGSEKVLADGTKMWGLFQEDGVGYAWMKADDVLDAVSKSAETGMKLVLK